MGKLLRQSLMMLLLMTAITGVVYPLLVTGIAQAVFPHQANGSVIERQGKALGSELIGQPFDQPGYFWSRPSATSPQAYNAGASSGSNQGTTNPSLADVVPLSKRWVIYRDAGVALTSKGKDRDSGRRFAAFLQSPEGARIFSTWGWMAGSVR